MRHWYVFPLLIAALVLAAACSDDDNDKKDTGVPDLAVTDQGPGKDDKGPGGDGPVVDQAPADGPGVQKVEAYAPADNDIQGWTKDSTKTNGAGYTKKDIEDLINGKHDPYEAEGCTGFVMQNYKKDFGGGCNGDLELMIWDMTAAAGAKKMFDKDKLDGEQNAGLTFETVQNVTTEGIIADDAPGWRAYAHKSTYIIGIWAMYTDGACKDTLKTDTSSWLETITKKLP